MNIVIVVPVCIQWSNYSIIYEGAGKYGER